VEIYEATVEAALPAIDVKPEVVLVDPPRTGLNPKVLEAIVQRNTPYVVYISCDPATLARDGKKLAASGFHLANIAIFDMFPQTFHIETISIWER
jgi:23S rRNA (uracil1939-C5)-methyltransferase